MCVCVCEYDHRREKMIRKMLERVGKEDHLSDATWTTFLLLSA